MKNITNRTHLLESSNSTTFAKDSFTLQCMENGQNIFFRSMKVFGDVFAISDIICENHMCSVYSTTTYDDDFSVFVVGDSFQVIIYSEGNALKQNVSVEIRGEKSKVIDIYGDISSKFEINNLPKIKWYYDKDGNYVWIDVENKKIPCSEFYPFLNGKSLEEYYQEFIDSESNVLLLIGPPGTAKTSFIRGLLQYSGSNAILTYDSGVLSSDSIFANFLSSKASFFIMEDSDAYLSSRENGNIMMNKFLNIADGLISDKSKKIIFTTNLPSLKDVDQALLREGRCHDVLHFGPLDREQATIVADKFGITLNSSKNEFTVAEIFNQNKDNTANNFRFGFGA